VHSACEIDWDSQGLRPASKLTPWPAVNGQRLAAVSAFGMSGTNAHVIVSMPNSSDDRAA
jgi:mycobactin polyketide synthetase MbtC